TGPARGRAVAPPADPRHVDRRTVGADPHRVGLVVATGRPVVPRLPPFCTGAGRVRDGLDVETGARVHAEPRHVHSRAVRAHAQGPGVVTERPRVPGRPTLLAGDRVVRD